MLFYSVAHEGEGVNGDGATKQQIKKTKRVDECAVWLDDHIVVLC